jgi:hypothetical protein
MITKGPKLTQKEAWLLLQEEWANPIVWENKTYVICEDEDDSSWGLCGCIETLFRYDRISLDICHAMIEQIEGQFDLLPLPLPFSGRSPSYLFPCTAAGAKQRAKLCGEFAERCQS